MPRSVMGVLVKALNRRDQRRNVDEPKMNEAYTGTGPVYVYVTQHHDNHEEAGRDRISSYIDDSIAPTTPTGTGTLHSVFSWEAYMLKAISGETGWNTVPSPNLKQHVTNHPIHVPMHVDIAATTDLTLSGVQTVDGVNTSGGKDVLVCGQTDKAENGIYTATDDAWIRRSDMAADADLQPGISVYIAAGGLNKKKTYTLTTLGPFTIGSTDLEFEELLGGGGGGIDDDYVIGMLYGVKWI
jgi:hypothetical protein